MTPGPAAEGRGARRVLVSGGAGFIGSHLIGRLLARGDAVTVVDNLSTGRRENLPAAHERLRFVEADLSAALAAFGPGERFDDIYHLAAAVGVKRVLDDPVSAIETNVERTASMLRFASRLRPLPRVLIASSSEVYGKSPNDIFSEDDDAVYGPTTVTRWSYACSKALDEHLALAHAAAGSLPVVVARFFNTVGPGQTGEYGMVLPRFVRAALDARPLEVHGDGAQSRCFCDVRDVVGVLPELLAAPAAAGRVFNVGSDRVITIGDLARLVVRVLGSPSPVRLVPYDRVYAAGFEDLRRRRPDLRRIRAAVGFEPSIPLERTIRDIAAAMGWPGPRPVPGQSRAPAQSPAQLPAQSPAAGPAGGAR